MYYKHSNFSSFARQVSRREATLARALTSGMRATADSSLARPCARGALQLNFYVIRRVEDDDDIYQLAASKTPIFEYRHKYLQRGKPELLTRCVQRTASTLANASHRHGVCPHAMTAPSPPIPSPLQSRAQDKRIRHQRDGCSRRDSGHCEPPGRRCSRWVVVVCWAEWCSRDEGISAHAAAAAVPAARRRWRPGQRRRQRDAVVCEKRLILWACQHGPQWPQQHVWRRWWHAQRISTRRLRR